MILLAMAADRVLQATESAANVTAQDIAGRAHDLYRARGGEHGPDLDDWLQAECELLVHSVLASRC